MKIKAFPFLALFVLWLTIAGAGSAELPAKFVSLFDGKTLNGWIQDPTNATALSRGDIVNATPLARKLSEKSDPVSAFLSGHLDDAAKAALAAYSSTNGGAKLLQTELAKSLSHLISGPSFYNEQLFHDVSLRAETTELLKAHPQGQALMRLNRLLLEDAYPKELDKSPASAWIVKDGAMASTGAGRGTIYTSRNYARYRLLFTMRHVSGKPDHQACVLVFCTRPPEGEKGLDALGGIQFQAPNGGHWDYRKGHNNGGKGEFTALPHPKFDPHEWSRVELLVDAAAGAARMAVAQPVGGKAVEVLDFKDPTAGQAGPVAWQMHNGGLFDEYKDVEIEVNPATNDLITVR